MSRVALWCKLAPYVTRVAKLSPLFAVSYLETVGRDPSAHVCIVKGKPKLMTCTACRKVRYGQKKNARKWIGQYTRRAVSCKP